MATLEKRKIDLIHSILNVDDEKILDELELSYIELSHGNSVKYPAQYTVEKLNEAADRAIQEVEEGKVIPHEELKKRFLA